MFGVLCYVDGFSVVLNAEQVICACYFDVLDRGLRLLLTKANDVVVCVDEKLIDQLVESRVDG